MIWEVKCEAILVYGAPIVQSMWASGMQVCDIAQKLKVAQV